jgi:hypothetical protein
MEWHVARIAEMTNAYKILIPERHRRKLEVNVAMDLGEKG